MVPIIPAIPRSLEKRKLKEGVKSSEDGGASASSTRLTRLQEAEESHLKTAATSSQTPQDSTSDTLDEKDNDNNNNGVQEARVETAEITGSEEGVASAEGKCTFQSVLTLR